LNIINLELISCLYIWLEYTVTWLRYQPRHWQTSLTSIISYSPSFIFWRYLYFSLIGISLLCNQITRLVNGWVHLWLPQIWLFATSAIMHFCNFLEDYPWSWIFAISLISKCILIVMAYCYTCCCYAWQLFCCSHVPIEYRILNKVSHLFLRILALCILNKWKPKIVFVFFWRLTNIKSY